MVNIYGSNYTVKVDDLDHRHIAKIADSLNGRMRELDHRMKVKSAEKVAVLTALNLENELFFAEADKNKLLEEYEQRVNSIISRVDNALLNSFFTEENPTASAKDIK
jgi:cell division protein ZapA (FtsZ GTPase activity inhibitor)